jgi:hypothetical protein
MFDEPVEDPSERASSAADRAREKSDEFRTHAELAAVFEGQRKFDAEILPRLDPEIARETQKAIGRLEKAKMPDSPLLSQPAMAEAAQLLDLPAARGLSTNDYHIYRRPGEAMILRWLDGDQVETFYARLQAHFDAALEQYREDEKQSQGWKQDPQATAYLKALDGIKLRMEEKYLREIIRKHHVFVLSTQAVDEMDIVHLCDYLSGVPAAEIVGPASAPPDEPTERDRAWFFKLFSLRGMRDEREQMCFFTFLQKSDEF